MVFTLLLTIIAVILQHTNYMTKTTMKRLTLLVFLIAGIANSISAMKTPTSQMEKLDRGLVAFRPGISIFVSWRLLGTDNPNTTFDLLRNGEVIATELKVTNYSDAKGNLTSKYQVIAKVNGETVDTSNEVQTWSTKNLTLQLQRPAAGKTKPYTTTINKETFSYPNGQDYSYTPNDMSVGDVDMAQAETKDADGNDATVYYIVKRVEGATGIVPYEQVKSVIDSTLKSYAASNYYTEQLDAWRDKADIVVDDDAVNAFDPAA